MNKADHSLSVAEERNLHGYHDGQLGPLANWWWRGRIARSARLREQLEGFAEVGEWVREADSQQSPDLWDSIALRLPAIDAVRADDESSPLSTSFESEPGWMARLTGFRPILAAATTAAVAVAVALVTIGEVPVQRPGAVRWLDTGGRSVIIVDNPDAATIVWLLEAPVEGV